MGVNDAAEMLAAAQQECIRLERALADMSARRRREVVIFDMDGTLADVSGLRHYLTADHQRKNFQKFHASSIFAPPHEPILALANALNAAGFRIIVVTARKEQWRYLTATWLQKHGVRFDALLMRADDDNRRDVDVKRDILAEVRRQHRVILAVDDNPSIIELWNAERIPVVTVPGWQVPAETAEQIARAAVLDYVTTKETPRIRVDGAEALAEGRRVERERIAKALEEAREAGGPYGQSDRRPSNFGRAAAFVRSLPDATDINGIPGGPAAAYPDDAMAPVTIDTQLAAKREALVGLSRKFIAITHEPLATKVAEEWADAILDSGIIRDEQVVKAEVLEEAAAMVRPPNSRSEWIEYAEGASDAADSIQKFAAEFRAEADRGE